MLTLQFLEEDTELALSSLTEMISDPPLDDHERLSSAIHVVSAQLSNQLVECATEYAIDYASAGTLLQ